MPDAPLQRQVESNTLPYDRLMGCDVHPPLQLQREPCEGGKKT